MRLVVYTAHKEEVYQPIVEEFERRTGVWVQVVSGGTTELLERIAAEAEAPVADVMFGGGVESCWRMRIICAVRRARAAMLEAAGLKPIAFVAFSRLPLVIIYNPRLVSSPPAGLLDLLEKPPARPNRVREPRRSGRGFTVLATLIQALGDEDALGRFADNVRPRALGSARRFRRGGGRNARGRDAIRDGEKAHSWQANHIAVV